MALSFPSGIIAEVSASFVTAWNQHLSVFVFSGLEAGLYKLFPCWYVLGKLLPVGSVHTYLLQITLACVFITEQGPSILHFSGGQFSA